MKSKLFALLLIAAATAFPQSLTLISPSGGEILSPGEQITVKWTKCLHLAGYSVFYSFDNGLSWEVAGNVPDIHPDSFPWMVPYTKQGTERALIKVRAFSVVDGPGYDASAISHGNFTIKPSTPDAYEPNDDFASAKLIEVGDSVVKNAVVYSYRKYPSEVDEDFFKVNLTAGMAATISAGRHPNDNPLNEGAIDFVLYDSSKTPFDSSAAFAVLFSGLPSGLFTVPYSGLYYIKIYSSGGSHVYNMTIRQGARDISLLSPSGGERFSGGQTMTINWTQGGGVLYPEVDYSLDNGANWNVIDSGANADSVSWIVPYLKKDTGALLRVMARFKRYKTSMYDSSYAITNAPITILAAPSADAYEPNHSLTSAYPISVGDSVVKNAVIFSTGTQSLFGTDSLHANDSSKEVDYFKVTLAGGKVTTVSVFDYGFWESRGEIIPEESRGEYIPMVQIMLCDASKQRVGYGVGTITCNIRQSGDYYCLLEDLSYLGDEGLKYGLSIHQTDGIVNVISPSGGESFSAGQKAEVRWTASASLGADVDVFYSTDSAAWSFVKRTDSASFMWTVPYKIRQKDRVFMKVVPRKIDGVIGMSGAFTILASPPDVYEPNNDFASAYFIGMGDSVVTNAAVIGEEGLYTNNAERRSDRDSGDCDYFKVALTGGKLTIVSATATARSYSIPLDWTSRLNPFVSLYDASHQLVAGRGVGAVNFIAPKSGNYFCTISSENDEWYVYNLSVKEATILSLQTSSFDTNALQMAGGNYAVRLIADTTKVAIDLSLYDKTSGAVKTMVISPDELAQAPNAIANVNAIAIVADPAISSSLKSAVITIPYNVANLSGYPQNSLTVLRLDNVTNQWMPLVCAVDTVNHEITAASNGLNVFGIFVKSTAAIGSARPPAARVFGIKAKYNRLTQGIAMHFCLPNAVNADVRLYNIQGRCVRKSAFSVVGQMNSTLLWNLGALGNGKYFLTVRAGNYYEKQAIVIMK